VHNDDLPLVVPPHPLYDLPPEELRELARRAYPLIVEQLTKQTQITAVMRVDYERPAALRQSTKERQ